ncbi:hypothetical protein CMUS01_05061 [Colletotrichum musicola]|uniref:Uncharacterized protein n=1 Tax=Colletotrichum musicola TaxID=2175873 RepID=A0A8H6NM07_9PEZI|nr:hypothetical protein CMUS01_05061 [Colletotrichum musicola]
MSSEFLTTQTIGGYLVVLALAGSLTYYYMADKNKAQAAKGVKSYNEPRKDNNAKKQRKAAFASQKSNVEDKASSTAVAPSGTWLSNDPKDDDGVDNKAFAKQMANVKEGKKFDGKATGEQKKKQKSVKQSRAAEKPVEEKPVEVAEVKEPAPAPAPASESEPEEEEEVESPADPTGVNDMLEPAAAGPSVLRLTGTDKEKPKAKNQKVPEKAETKKQRQNRQKNEAKKAAREEEEKERKAKLEKQRRTAREAAGVPAKDGSQFMAAVNGKSAWTAGSPNGASTNGSSAAVQPLDTFETPAKNGTAAAPAAAAPAPASDNWISSLPSEEEQMQRLKEEDEWNTVPTKASKKAKKTSRAASASPEPTAPAVAAAPAAAAPAAPAQSRPIAQAVQKPAASNGKAAKPVNSFSALSTDDKEEEWDV